MSPRQKWALLVGVASFQRRDAGLQELRGPRNDLPAMQELLLDHWGVPEQNVRLLLDRDATREGILAGWEWLIENAKSNDEVVFYYSGHGLEVPDPTKIGGKGSAICPFDISLNPLSNEIRGPEIGTRIDRLKTNQVTVIIDACHSGVGSRYAQWGTLPTTSRLLVPKGVESGLSEADFAAAANAAKESHVDPELLTSRGEVPRETYLGASKLSELACEAPLLPTAIQGNPYMGAFTFYLLEVLRGDPEGILTAQQIAARIHSRLKARFGPLAQTPVGKGAGRDQPLLRRAGAATLPISPMIEVLEASQDRVRVRALRGVALEAESLFVSADGVAAIHLNEAGGREATGTKVRGEIRQGQVLIERVHGQQEGPCKVAIVGEHEAVLRDRLAYVSEIDMLSSPLRADLIFYATEYDRIRPFLGVFPLSLVTLDGAEALVHRIRAARALLRLRNSVPAFGLKVLGNGEEGFLEFGAEKEKSITLTLQAEIDCHVAVLGIGSDGVSGRSKTIPLKRRTPYSITSRPFGDPGLQIIKVIALPRETVIPVPEDEIAIRKTDPESVTREILRVIHDIIWSVSDISENTSDSSSSIWATAELNVVNYNLG